MMADSKQDESGALTLRYLGQVLDVLLDPNKKIVDDTSLQRLLEYCKKTFSCKEICQEEEGLKHVFDFLEACCARDPSEFDPCALTFALQLIRCLTPNPELMDRLMVNFDEQSQIQGGAQGCLLVKLLKRASNGDFFSDPCMKEAWLTMLLNLSIINQFWTICIQTDALRIAMELLKDTSMFVVKSSQKFLARVLLLQYKHNAQGPCLDPPQTPQTPQTTESTHDQEAGSSQATVQECKDEALTVLTEPVQVDAKLNGGDAPGDDCESVKRKLDEATAGKESTDTPSKKLRVSTCRGDAENTRDMEVIELCERLMESKEAASILASLLLDLEPSDSQQQTLLQVSKPSDSDVNTILSLGVFRCILNDASQGDASSRTAHLLRDIAMATRCKKLLIAERKLSDNLCEDVVEFFGCLFKLESEPCSQRSSSLLLDVQFLPSELTRRGLVKPAIHLALRIVKLWSTMKQSSLVDDACSLKSSWTVLFGPFCAILDGSLRKAKETFDQDVLQELTVQMANGRQSPSIVCTSASALGDLVKEGQDFPCLPPYSVFHSAVVLLHAVTPNAKKTFYSKALLPDYKSLVGSRKIMTSLLDLAQTSISVHSGNCWTLDIWLLVDTINTILKNPDADYQVVLKILAVVPDLVSVSMETDEHPVSIENTKREALLMEVGYGLQKRMCNIEWEVRDSTITCVGKLLQKNTDAVKKWLKRNDLHVRLWESLEDSESYVRSSTLQALPVLQSCKGLWEHVLSCSRITLVEVVAKLREIIKTDSEAFPRRAAIGCLLTWLKDEPWMQDGIKDVLTAESKEKSSQLLQDGKGTSSMVKDSLGSSMQGQGIKDVMTESKKESAPSIQDDTVSIVKKDCGASIQSQGIQDTLTESKDKPAPPFQDDAVSVVKDDLSMQGQRTADGKSITTTTEMNEIDNMKKDGPEAKVEDATMTLGELVLDAVSMATCDFDWEIKLRALDFYLHLMTRYIPGYDSAVTSSSLDPHFAMQRTKLEELLAGRDLRLVVTFFTRTGCLARLAQGSGDEDVSVARKACEMLQSLKVALGTLFKERDSSAQRDRTENSISSDENVQPSINKQSKISSTEKNGNTVTQEEISATGAPDIPMEGSCSDFDRRSLCDLLVQLFESDWNALLKERESDNVEGPVSLMMDILAAADKKDENLLDCY
ncbi:BRCA1-associated ATM activator 1-like [Lytechinus variegatus]|uniref:BRCA1-associated ATM activator 1-like n=1 Tax=Lytechinus variegatus TaxID=7654 RepID=UPI001BB1F6F5|nr:BRCA1-associated ATM activator 1-like [Lytechinus variegatus]